MTQLRERLGPLPVGSDAGARQLETFRFRHAGLAAAEDEARRQSLDVPLPRTTCRLVEIVEVEHQPPLGCGIATKIREMRVSAHLDIESSCRSRGKVAGHHARRPAEKCQRRSKHSAVAERYESRQAVAVLTPQHVDRVRTVRCRCPAGLIRSTYSRTQRLALCPPIADSRRQRLNGLVRAMHLEILSPIDPS